jgi:hypothetical protein
MILRAIIFIFALVTISCNRTQPVEAVKETHTQTLQEQFEKANSENFDSTVAEFTANYLIKRNLFEPWLEEMKPPLTTQKIKNLYYIYFLEKRDFDTVKVELYKFGTYSSNDGDRVLIRKSTDPEFQVLGDSTIEYNAIMIDRFINQYSLFSDSTKVRLYNYCIDSYTYGRTYIE